MERGSYTAASGGLYQLRKLDLISNNLANVNTPGYKKQLIIGEKQNFDETFAKLFESKDPYAKGDHDRAQGVSHIRTITDFSVGPIRNTSNPLDVALQNEKDFFVVNTPQGPQYTRAGNFSLNSEGVLITADGLPVSGDGGEITIQGTNVTISPSGVITAGRVNVGRLQVVRIENSQDLERVGSSRFTVRQGGSQPAPVETEVVPQALEMSNVTVINSMVDMISTNRAFEMYAKVAQTVDGMNQSAITQVGRRG
jgi:flagellar basal-body rod protein FlgF